MIFCFSGTGNSRYIARRFAEALQNTIIVCLKMENQYGTRNVRIAWLVSVIALRKQLSMERRA